MNEAELKEAEKLANMLTGLCDSISILIAATANNEKSLADGILLAHRAITSLTKGYFEEKQKLHGSN